VRLAGKSLSVIQADRRARQLLACKAWVGRQRRGNRVDSVDWPVAVGRVLHPRAHQRLDIRLQHLGDVDENGELVDRANPSLNLRQPRLGPADQARELLLTQAAPPTVNPNALADRAFKRHVCHTTWTASPRPALLY